MDFCHTAWHPKEDLVVTKATTPVSFAGSQLDDTRHVCAFFNSEDEGYRVLLPFIKEGFERGDKAIHVVSPQQYDSHLQRLAGVGIDPMGAIQSRQFEVQINTEAYLRNGRFDQDRMLQTFEEMASGNAAGGFPLSRIVCNMDWAASEAQSHMPDLIEFEARVNDVWLRHDDVVICVYDLNQIGGDVVIDIMRTHPMIIIGGTLHKNPFYIPPQEFLRVLRERRAGRALHTV